MEKVRIKCQSCQGYTDVKRTTLSKHFGRNVKIKCSSCGDKSSVKVNAALFSSKSTSTQERKTLVFHEGDVKTESSGELYVGNSKLDLGVGNYILGRKSSNEPENKITITTTDTTVSRNHFELNITEAFGKRTFSIKDNSSTNGTYVGEQRLDKYDEIVLSKGDVIIAGNTEIKFK